MAPEIIVQRLNDIAHKRGLPLIDILLKLGVRWRLPRFTAHLIDDLGLDV